MARRNWMRVVIVVPALTEGQKRNPPAVRRKVARLESPRAPRMCRGIHQPRRMEAHNGSRENAPHHERPSANCEQYQAKHDYRNVMIFRDPDHEFVFGKV